MQRITNAFNWLRGAPPADQTDGRTDELAIESITKTLGKGGYLWKVRSYTRWFQRWFYVDADSQQLCYHRSGFRKAMWFFKSKVLIDFGDIVDVRKGWRSDTFNQMAKQVKRKQRQGVDIDESTCFTVVVGGSKRKFTLDLVTSSSEECDTWVRGLRHMLHMSKTQEQGEHFDRWLAKMFKAADDNKDGGLSFEECLTLLKKMNVKLRKSYAKKLFNQANTVKRAGDSEQVLDADEFVAFYHLLMSRPEINTLFDRYCDENDELGAEQLSKFLFQEQQISKHPDDCMDLITEFEPSDSKYQKEPRLSVSGFTNLLLSEEFQLCNQMHLNEVFQDMTQPLAHYFIASSHNTYLIGNQLSGESSVEGYIGALMRGCRCVELDCWDGPKGEPVVYHGFTLTSKIMFHDIITDALLPYAFKVSDYPVILSLEVHCSPEQQARMAHHLTTILGDMLYMEPTDGLTQLPSPDELRNKIIVKAKKLRRPPVDATDADEAARVEISESESEEESDEEVEVRDGVVNSVVIKKYNPIECHLSDLVNLCQAVHFHGFLTAKHQGRCYTMSSFAENKAKKLIANEYAAFVDYNSRQLSRIYPAGKRADSSNFNPIQFWNAGCQIVALNYQGTESPIFYNEAKFKINGNCGYLLKPSYMRQTSSFNLEANPTWKPKLLRLRIISGQHIPKPDQSTDGEVVDPYVKVKMVGMDIDQKEYKTKDIHDNGLNPVWDEVFEFPVYFPDLAILHLTVKDDNNTGVDEQLGSFALPFISIQPGYSHCALLNELRQPLAPATLFVHVTLQE